MRQLKIVKFKPALTGCFSDHLRDQIHAFCCGYATATENDTLNMKSVWDDNHVHWLVLSGVFTASEYDLLMKGLTQYLNLHAAYLVDIYPTV